MTDQILLFSSDKLLLDAYKAYKSCGGTFNLTLIGSIDEISERSRFNIVDQSDIKFFPFMQPAEVANTMNSSKVFILPSYRDHWGTVLCEAAACGCLLIASNQSGSSTDLIRCGINGFTFDSKVKSSSLQLSLLMAKIELISLSDTAQSRSNVSISLASNFNELSYSLALQTIFA